jgi:hypothetical protein
MYIWVNEDHTGIYSTFYKQIMHKSLYHEQKSGRIADAHATETILYWKIYGA